MRQQPARNPIDAAEKYLKNNKNKKQERKQTQYLTRFDNLPTSSEQGREILLFQQPIQFVPCIQFKRKREREFIDSTTNTICTLHTIQEGSTLLFIVKDEITPRGGGE